MAQHVVERIGQIQRKGVAQTELLLALWPSVTAAPQPLDFLNIDLDFL